MEDFFEDLKNQPRPNFFRRIWLWWHHDGKYLHKEIKWGIQNLIYWFPIIWKDRNWDSHYIFDILKHKLKAQAKYIGDRDLHTRAQLDAKRMRLCVKLIEKVQEEDYDMEYMDYHKNRQWFTPVEGQPTLSQWNSEVTEENFDEYFKKYPRIYKRVMNGEGPYTLDGKDESEIKRIIAMSIGHINQERVFDLLFKIIKQDIRGWWS
jgi:hypothetical protein